MTLGLGIISVEDKDGDGFWIYIGLIFVISMHFKR